MMQWMKNIICSICILGALMHILPDSAYRKYVNFYVGLLIILMVLQPLISVFSIDETFTKTLQIQELKRELSELNLTWEGLEDLGTKRVEEAWKEELETQITEAAKACEFEVSKINIELQTGEDGKIAAVSVSLQVTPLYPSKDNAQEKKAELYEMIMDVYEIERDQIQITVWE